MLEHLATAEENAGAPDHELKVGREIGLSFG